MAGFKQTIQHHLPKMLLSFDGDQFDPGSRKLISVPQTFLDESGYESNILLHNDDENYPAYRMGIPSLVDIEQTDQHSLSFGWYGYQPLASFRWPKAVIEVQHQDHLALDDNLGSYTVGFFVNKAENDNAFREQERILGFPYTLNLNRRFIRKAGSFDIWYRDYWNTDVKQIRVGHPGGSDLVWDVPSWFFKRKNFITVTWSVKEINPDIYLNEACFYVNGHLYVTWSETTAGRFNSSRSVTPIEIGGVIPYASNYEDRQCSDVQMDQIFLLNKAMTADEICHLYRKSKTYDTIAIDAQAQAYWPMTDVEDTASFVMQDMVGYNNGVYLGGLTRLIRERDPPSTILGGSSVYFHNGGMAAAHRLDGWSNTYTPLFNFNGDFTVDFWFMFENTDRSVIWGCSKEDFPHSGVVVEANRRNWIAAPGHIQLSLSQEYQISSMLLQDNGQPYNFNDGRWHHVAAVRKGSSVSLWIDGINHGTSTVPVQSIANPAAGQVYFMGHQPGSLNTTGNMSACGVYGYALDDAEVRMRNLYSLIYRIKGVVTLQGNPYQATIRAYNHRTGELEVEEVSEPSSGDYMITLYDNSRIDLMVMNKQDPNIRYRVYGPIEPALYEDAP